MAWPKIADSKDHRIKIIVSPQWDHGKRKEADLLIIGDFKNPIKIKIPEGMRPLTKTKRHKNGEERIIKEEGPFIAIKNFIFVVECKKVAPKMLKVELGHVKTDTGKLPRKELMVTYNRGGWYDNVTTQNEESLFGFRDQVKNSKHNPNKNDLPCAARGIFLQNIKDKYDAQRVFSSNDSWNYIFLNIIQQIFRFSGPKGKLEEDVNIYSSYNQKYSDFYYKANYLPSFKPSDLDQKQMLTIARKIRSDARWPESVGKKLLMIKGGGGTGKTIKMLQLAKNIYNDEARRIIILTYNVALVSNIRRLMSLMGIRSINEKGGGIHIQSVQSYMYELIDFFKLLTKKEKDNFLNIYPNKIKELSDLIKGKALSEDELREGANKYQGCQYDYAFIDEGQDWPNEEAFVISKIFGYQNTVVAHGINQEVRGEVFDWNTILPNDKDRQETRMITRPKKARRMKSNLLSFTQEFSRDLLLDDAYMEMEPQEEGGSVFIIVGNYLYANKMRFEKFLKERKTGVTYNIDLLNCVPSVDTIKINKEERRYSKSAKIYGTFGYPLWDATGEKTRREMPDTTNVMRFVNYQSSRGLEGWSVFCHGFDSFWDEMIKKGGETYEVLSNQSDLFISASQNKEEFVKDYAAKWCCIATTRAVDSIVIQINNKNSFLGKKLFDMSKQTDFIYWLEDN